LFALSVQVRPIAVGELGSATRLVGSAGMSVAAAAMDEIILVPDAEVGKMPIRETLTTESIEVKTQFKTGWLVWMELGQGVTRPEILVKIRILG